MKIVIVGAGGQGRVVLEIIRNYSHFEIVGFLDSNKSLHGKKIDGFPVLGDINMLFGNTMNVDGAIIAIGDNAIRCRFAEMVSSLGIKLINAIHPSATIAQNAIIGNNVVIAQGAIICTHVKIGNSVICNTGSIIDHESEIHEGAHICPGVKLAGHVTVHREAFVGIGATVIQNTTIGESATVGAGAVVLRNINPQDTVVGVPAKRVLDKPDIEKPHINEKPISPVYNSNFGPTIEIIESFRKNHSRIAPPKYSKV